MGNNGSVNVVGDGLGNPTAAGGINFNPSGGDNFNAKRLAARLVFKPETNGGLALGIASVLSHYSAAGTPDIVNPNLLFNDMAQLLLEGEIVYIDDKLELLSEFYNFDDAIGLGGQNGNANNYAFYAQLAYQAAADLKPYFRVESLVVGGSDPFFTDLGYNNRTVYLAGIRYDIAPLVSSLKLEAHFINNGGPDNTEVAAAWGWGF